MARKELSEQERQQIKTSLEETRKRRKNQFIKVVELKVNCHHTSKETYKLFNQYFKEAKWVYNDMLSASQTRNIFDYTYTEHKEIQRLDKDKNSITEKVTIPSVYHRAMVKQVKTNISNHVSGINPDLESGRSIPNFFPNPILYIASSQIDNPYLLSTF